MVRAGYGAHFHGWLISDLLCDGGSVVPKTLVALVP